MAGDTLPEAVRGFLTRYISTVEQLELLLFLYRNAGNAWTAEEVARQLAISQEAAATQLDAFREQALLARDEGGGGYRFSPPSPEANLVLAELSRLYLERRVAVITFIYTKPNDRLRSFSDAFKFRKEE